MKDCKAKTAGTKPGLKIAHRNDRAAVRHWLAGNGQALLPILQLLDNVQASIDGLMNEAARGLSEQLLALSAQELAGAKLRGRAGGEVLWHGTRRGQVRLAERKLRVTHPRLRSKATSKEVAVPAYERLTGNARMGARVRDILGPARPRAGTNRCCPRWRGPWACPRARCRAAWSKPAPSSCARATSAA